MEFLSLVGLGVASFVGTNIDDLLILLVFFASPRFPKSHIILGQYLGMAALIGLALVGSLVALVVPYNLLALIGIFPIAIGVKELLVLRRNYDDEIKETSEKISKSRWMAYLPFLTTSAITFSGGEEFGIYISVFATNNEVAEIATVILVVVVLTGVWSAMAYYLVSRPSVAQRIQRIGHTALPIVLIGLGTYILAEAFLVL